MRAARANASRVLVPSLDTRQLQPLPPASGLAWPLPPVPDAAVLPSGPAETLFVLLEAPPAPAVVVDALAEGAVQTPA